MPRPPVCKIRDILALVASVGAALVSGADFARADEGLKSILDPGYVVELQFGPGMQPTYPGATFYRPVPVPGILVRRVDEPVRFAAPDDGFGAPVIDSSGLRVGPVANVMIPHWRTHAELRDLHKVRTAVEVGSYAEYFVDDNLRTRFELRRGVYGHDGVVAVAGTDFIQRFGAFTTSLGPRLYYGSQAFSRAYFGIAPYEAVANGHVYPFRAHSGLTSAGGLSTARYEIDQRWSATAYGGLQRLTGSAAASPISNVLGSRNQFSAGMMLGYAFNAGPL